MKITLSDLIRPLDPADFIRDYWFDGPHHLSEPNEELVRKVLEIEEFADLRKLLKKVGPVTLFGPNAFRSEVPSKVAYDFYERGDTLYMKHVEQYVPDSFALFHDVVQELGVEGAAYIEAFATKSGGISSLHYDHDVNFQILLRGSKTWRVQPNSHIVNPLRPHHKLPDPQEEAYAHRLPMPNELDAPIEVVAVPGTTMFFRSGYWHEVVTSADAFSVNFVFNSVRWAHGLASALVQRLITSPVARGHSVGLLGDGSHPLLVEHGEKTLAELKALAHRAIDEITASEIGASSIAERVRWSSKAKGRCIKEVSPEQ